jgi:hypothetical protein
MTFDGDGKDGGRRELERGLRELRRHRPDLALGPLRRATESCPAVRPAELSRRLYWLALALLQLGRPELAMKSLASAQKLRPRGYARLVYKRRVNEYGMPRRGSAELDDFYAFYSIKVCSFLGRRPGHRFASESEKDSVTRIVATAWQALRKSGRLEGRGPAERLSIFRDWPAHLPDFLAPHGLGARSGAIQVDFRKGRAIGPNDRCCCGSGLPYRQCCGRTDASSCIS